MIFALLSLPFRLLAWVGAILGTLVLGCLLAVACVVLLAGQIVLYAFGYREVT